MPQSQLIAPGRYTVTLKGEGPSSPTALPSWTVVSRKGQKSFSVYVPDMAKGGYVMKTVERDQLETFEPDNGTVNFVIGARFKADREQVLSDLEDAATYMPSTKAYLPAQSLTLKPGDRCRSLGNAVATVVAVSQCGGYVAVCNSPHFDLDAFNAGATTCLKYKIEPRLRLQPVEQGTKSLMHLSRPSYLHLEYLKTSIDGLVLMLLDHKVMDEPWYQRDYTWSDADREAFILSLLMGRDVGKFAFHEAKAGHALEVVDGKQRCHALMQYFGGHFPVAGAYYHELDSQSQRHLCRQTVNVALVGREGASTEQLAEIFLDINFAGVPQDPAHLAKVRDTLDSKQA